MNPEWQGSGVRKFIQTERIGKQAQLHVHLLKQSSITQNDVIATLPAVLRPRDEAEFVVGVLTAGSAIGCGMLTVRPDGSVLVNTSVSGARWAIGTVGYMI